MRIPDPSGFRSPRLFVLLILAVLSLGSPFSMAQAQPAVDLPADLDLVPRDAAAFLHFRARDLWQGEWNKDLRYLLDKAGPEAWKEFERRCPLDPKTIDRLTLVMVTPQALGDWFPTVDPEAMSALVVVRLTEPYDRLQLVQAVGCREKAYRRNVYYFHEDLWSGLVLVDERTFLIGSEDAVIRWFDMMKNKSADGPLQAALREAAQKHHVAFGLNPTLLGKIAPGLPGPMQSLLEAQCATVTLDLDKETRIDLKLDYLKAEQAVAGEKALRDTLDMGRQALTQPIAELEKLLKESPPGVDNVASNFAYLIGLGFLREADTMLKDAPIQRQGTSVLLPLRYRKLDTTQLPMVSLAGIQVLGRNANAVFKQVGQAIGKDNKNPNEDHLKQLGQALEKYHADKGSYPPAVFTDPLGRPLFSWRVALLPYLGEEGKALFNEFRFDEPWDSLHNKRLLKKMPQAFRAPNFYGWGARRMMTKDQLFTGAGTFFEGTKGPRRTETGGKTVLVATVPDDHAVYWTKPADVRYVADKPLQQLLGPKNARFFFGSPQIHVLLVDGTYRMIDLMKEESDLQKLIQRTKP